MRRRHFLAAQAWYGISQGAPAFINPFLNLFFARINLSPSQIGLLTALRPWISAPCGSIVAGLADRWEAHRSMLLAAYFGMTFIQGLMALPMFASFSAMLALTILTSCVYTPASIIADAAVMAASTHPGDYGRLRTWASVSWTAFAPLAGWVNSAYGIRVGIACYVVGSLLAVPAALLLPVEALRRKVAPIIERGLSKEPEEVPPPAGAPPLTPGLPELQQSLLAEEAPPTPTPAAAVERHGLSKALAIIRYIEAITELGVAPPPGVGMYGYAALPLQYAAQHLAPAEVGEEEEVAVAGQLPSISESPPGYSPFSGGAEPGSESPAYNMGAGAGAGGGGGGSGEQHEGKEAPTPQLDAVAAPPTAPSLGARRAAPSGAEQASQASLAPGGMARQAAHGGSLSSLPQFQPPPRPATLPRPISADNLARVASLAQGIPRVRTSRSQLQLHEVESAPVLHEESSPSSHFGSQSEPESESEEGREGEQAHGRLGPASDIAFFPAGRQRRRRQPGSEEEDGAAAGAVFDADDLPAGPQHAQQAARELQHAASASLLLRDVRGVRPGLQPSAPAAGGALAPAAATAPAPAKSGSDELPVSFSPDQAAAAAETGRAGAGAGAGTGTGTGAGATPGQAALAAAGGEAAEPGSVVATPAFRSAAVQRLIQIFGGGSGGGRGAAIRRGSSGSEGSVGTIPPTPARAAEPAGSANVAGGDLEAGEGGFTFSQGGLTPVRRYIDYRRGKLEQKQQRRQQREAAAAAEGRELEPPTPLASSAAALACMLFGPSFTLLPPSWQAATQGQAGMGEGSEGGEGGVGVGPQVAELREALELELQDAAQEHDPTGSLIVGMLSKKLERLAAETKRQQRLRRRAARHAQVLAAGAAAAAPAGPAAADSAAVGVAAWRPEGQAGEAVKLAGEEATVAKRAAAEEQVAAGAEAHRQPGFGAALKRLLSDTQVATFFCLTAVLGFGHGIIGGFLFMYLSQLGGSEMLMGSVLVANALPELPAFFFFGSILHTLGMNTLLLASAATLGLRIWAYSLLPSISLHWVIPIEALHAITYACGWSASAVNSAKIAPQGLEGTTQAIFQGLWTGVGCGVAGLLGGVLYGSHGPAFLFRLSGILILGATAAAAVPLAVVRWRRKHREALPAGESYDELPSLAH